MRHGISSHHPSVADYAGRDIDPGQISRLNLDPGQCGPSNGEDDSLFSGKTMMTTRTWTRIGRRMTAALCQWRFPTLARPLGRISDHDIDAALERAGVARADLFKPAGAIARHRIHMAHMLAARHVDIAWATAERWAVLKLADDVCASCPSTGRCRRWLEAQGPSAAPIVFCPNAGPFDAMADHQSVADDRQ
jgi:hypothetical protein